jgi:Predicted transcriptional regulators
MTLGEKIKKSRTESGMTQTELAGDYITRNMLSQIENNSAVPSVPTIKHIAKKLNIPVGYFLSDDDNEFSYKKTQVIDDIKSMFREKQHQHCIDLCIALNTPDDEIEFILSNCYFSLAYDNFVSGNLKTAETLFTKSLSHAHNTVYVMNKSLHISALFLEILKSFNNNLIKKNDSANNSAPYVETMTYLNIIAALNQKKDISGITNDIKLNKVYLKHIEAKKFINKENYTEAEVILSDLITRELRPFERYMIIVDMESCYVHLDDFKNAYQYSTMKNELYKNMFNN